LSRPAPRRSWLPTPCRRITWCTRSGVWPSPSRSNPCGSSQPLVDEQPEPIQLHPNLPALHRRKIATPTQSLDTAEIREEAAATLRRLIDKVVITPRAGRGIEAVLHGDLAQLLAVCEAARADSKRPSGRFGAEGLLSVVAGARNRVC
jgi:hypothetical protein